MISQLCGLGGGELAENRLGMSGSKEAGALAASGPGGAHQHFEKSVLTCNTCGEMKKKCTVSDARSAGELDAMLVTNGKHEEPDMNAEVRADVLRLSIAVQRMQMLASKSGLVDGDGLDGSLTKGFKHSRPLSSNSSHHSHHHHHGNCVLEETDAISLVAQNAATALKGAGESLRGSFSRLEKMLRSESADEQLEATKRFRQLLQSDRDPMLQELVDKEIVPKLLKFLKDKSNASLQVEALWALTNIAAGTTEQTHLLIKNNAVPTLVSLLSSSHHEVLEQAVWVLGNIAGDDASARDTVLNAGALKPLLRCMDENHKPSFLRIATWTLSNLCDGQPRPIFDVVAVLKTVNKVLQTDDTEVLSHACWALSHLCDGPSPHIQEVVRANVCSRLVELLGSKTWRVVKPALRTVGNIVCAEDDQDYTQHIIECGAVPCLRQLIGHSNREIQKEACWTISNISAGTVEQIQCVLDSGGIPPLIKLASDDGETDPDVKIEACWVLLNATSCGSDSQIEHLVKAGCVQVLCNLLHDTSMVMMALEGLEKILQVGEDLSNRTRPPGTNPHAILLDTQKIAALRNHRSTPISKRANRMWNQHFVTCAICQTAYSRHSPSTFFCKECKCNVCTECDCSVFHLSYQDQLWKDLAEGEANKEKSKQQSKKSKRQRKRAKDKKKKELLKAAKEQGSANAGANSDGNTPPERAVRSANGRHTPKDKDKETNSTKNSGGVSPTAAASSASSSIPNGNGKSHTATAAIEINPANEQTAINTSPLRKVNGERESKTSITGDDLEVKTPKKNEEYVDYLMQSGSILDLWDMMNDSEEPPKK